MPSFNIVKTNNIKEKSFRVAQLYDQFDLQENAFTEHFTGDIDLPDEWNVGVIVGKSGTGKTTIAQSIFKEGISTFTYCKDSVIDDFDEAIGSEKLFSTLSSVGFNSPVSWLKPYNVLSNGEKMRVDLARAILQDKEIIVFDEYTSVVDREVAKIGSISVQKAIRKTKKKFIAVSCHYDIIEWLEPDWIFDTDEMIYKNTRGLLRRPNIELKIYKTKGNWGLFSKYHYLNHSAVSGHDEYTAFIEDKAVAIIIWMPFPHPKTRIRRVHRLVVLPDYQGIGIGNSLLNYTARIMQSKTKTVLITTSVKGFAKSLQKNKEWALIRAGRVGKPSKTSIYKVSSMNRNTYSFAYIGGV